ncbi:MAG: hypothetical protein ACTHPO_12090 [Alphaproteobacteria bacterium]
MPVDDRKLHQYHSKNLSSLDSALLHTALAAKEAIRLRQHKQVTIFNRMYALTLGAWAEVRLLKLLYDTGGFPVVIRRQVEASDTLYERWEMCIEKAFEHKYNRPTDSLPKTAKLRYELIIKYLETHLKPTITIRNKLAHGQWIYPLNCDLSSVEESAKASLEQQNIMILQYKKNMLNAIASVIHDLVVSRPTFERDFDKHFQKVDDIERDISTRTYKSYVKELIKRFERGKQIRNA